MVLAVATFAVLDWARRTYHVVSPHTQLEARLALVTWIGCLAAALIVPILIGRLSHLSSPARRWPLVETIGLIGTTGFSFSLLFFHDVLPLEASLRLESLPLDLIATFLAYLAAILAYAFCARNVIAGWRAKQGLIVLANGATLSLAAMMILILSWAMIYVE